MGTKYKIRLAFDVQPKEHAQIIKACEQEDRSIASFCRKAAVERAKEISK